MAKKKITVPEGETKKQKFVRVAQPRVNKAISMIGLIGNCAGSEYEYKPDDVANIIGALETAVVLLDERFKGKGTVDTGFKF